jgi:hypothetical protein
MLRRCPTSLQERPRAPGATGGCGHCQEKTGLTLDGSSCIVSCTVEGDIQGRAYKVTTRPGLRQTPARPVGASSGFARDHVWCRHASTYGMTLDGNGTSCAMSNSITATCVGVSCALTVFSKHTHSEPVAFKRLQLARKLCGRCTSTWCRASCCSACSLAFRLASAVPARACGDFAVVVVLPHPLRTTTANTSARIPATVVGGGLRWHISELPLGSMLP